MSRNASPKKRLLGRNTLEGLNNESLFGRTVNNNSDVLIFAKPEHQSPSLRLDGFWVIDRKHKWPPINNYSFLFVLVSLTGLVSMRKIQKNFHTEMRLVRLIRIYIKE